MKKLLSSLLILAIITITGWYVYKRIISSDKTRSAAGPSRQTAVAVEIQHIRKDTIKDVGIFTGSLIPKSQFVVAAKVAGWLKKLLVNIGDSAQQNQVIAILDDEEYRQQVEQAKAELQVAKANTENCASDLNLAQREYERAKALREKQIASASELEGAEAAFNASQTKLKVSLAQVTQREAALKAADLRLSYTRVQAFWEDGNEPSPVGKPESIGYESSKRTGFSNGARVVGERFVDEGTLLQANQPIVSVLENKPLTAVVYVVEKDYPKVSIGQRAIITTDAHPDKTFSGNIVRIAPLLKESSRQGRIEIEISNSEELLRPGMFIRAQIVFASHDNATLVPLAALIKRDGRQGVFTADRKNLKARFVPVTTGIISGESAEIVEPSSFGESEFVITLGNHLLEDGSGITISGRSPQKEDAASGIGNGGTKSGGAQ